MTVSHAHLDLIMQYCFLAILVSTLSFGEDNVPKKVEMLAGLHDARREHHDANYVKNKLLETTQELGVELDEIVSITTDGGLCFGLHW